MDIGIHCNPFRHILSSAKDQALLHNTTDITQTAGTVDPSMQTQLQFEAANNIAKQDLSKSEYEDSEMASLESYFKLS